MPATPLARRPRKTREEIYSAAMELFAQRGVAEVTMKDIAERAETARSTVFNHYPQKMDLIVDFYQRFAAAGLANAKARNSSGFRDGMRAFFAAIQEEALKVEPILREVAGMTLGAGPLVEEEEQIDSTMIDFISGVILNGIKAGELHPDLDVTETAMMLLCVLSETNHIALAQHRVEHVAEAHQKRLDILFRGLGAR